jgi:hypothetical protein
MLLTETSQLKKGLMALGAITLTVIVGITIVFAIMSVMGPKFDSESKKFVEETVPIICSSWNYQDLTCRASTELLNSASDEDFKLVFKNFSEKLGHLKKHKVSAGEARIGFFIQNGKVVTADYIVDAEFDKGPATIHIRLIKRGDKWQYKQFFINSPAFIR